ncbi:aceric acid hydrolase [Sunxiuqinia indica]|uniref:aceric acid hydrolase n=1 Tax=Sunxiuqinia indica TaxID=2692584 RepID=UPI001915C621|nr:glycoside hydrolase family 127 protein [Sunxiuqinia indica]
MNKIMRRSGFLSLMILFVFQLSAQEKSLVNTSKSPHAKLSPVNFTDVNWTDGFWAERFRVCEQSMVPHMMGMYMNDSISHGFANFEIAAGLKEGEHVGPPFHDGDFYKILEALIVVYSMNQEEELEHEIDSIIDIIGKTQREDGYIHTPVVIEQLNSEDGKAEFAERLDFETYNMGHLMTAACIHYRITGKRNLLDIAIKATNFLYDFYQRNKKELALNAICPSHYMGVTEMYRTTGDPKYLELAQGLIDIRAMVEDGHDHNQDRIPFRQQTKAIGHAVRANYLYAGVADVYAETGDESLMNALDAIWHDLVETKLYITGACGALYDGVSPNGTTYDQPSIQQVHQAYGQDYELPNFSAHNESCANIGNLLWNWRMFLATGQAEYADIMEQVMYNSLLAGVSLDGERYFYTNPLAVSSDLPFELRWSKDREEYIGYCNCCPPNTIRTVAEIHNYLYSMSNDGLWFNFYAGNHLKTELKDGSKLELEQITDYPWSGDVTLKITKAPNGDLPFHIRIPSWCEQAEIKVNGEALNTDLLPGTYCKIDRRWEKGDHVELKLAMPVSFIEANPLVEETRNQVAVQRGPVVYCLESVDLPEGVDLFQVAISPEQTFTPEKTEIANSQLVALKGKAELVREADWDQDKLYRKISAKELRSVPITLIPYYAWDNRGKCDMSVWLQLAR